MIDKDKLTALLERYFEIGDSYTYELTRVKSAFEIGTMTFDDFEEWTEANVYDLVEWIAEHWNDSEASNG